MPEGMYFLSHACLYLSQCPKSNSTKAIFEVNREISERGVKDIPSYLKDKTANKLGAKYLGVENASEEYKYPHGHPNNWVDQQYLPDELKDKKWYEAGTQGREALLWKKWQEIKNQKPKDSED